MNCYAVREKLEAYLDEGLLGEDSQSIDRHLQQCGGCARELETLRKVDSLVKMDLYESPAEEYWASLPKTIVGRLPMKPSESKIQLLKNRVEQFFSSPAVGWGTAFAAAAITIVFLSQRFVEDTRNATSSGGQVKIDSDAVPSQTKNGAQTQPGGNSQKVTVGDEVRFETELNSASATARIGLSNRLDKDVAKRPLASVATESVRRAQFLLTRTRVEKASFRKSIAGDHEYSKEIYPLAGHLALMRTQAQQGSENDGEEDSALTTFTFTSGVGEMARGSGNVRVEPGESDARAADPEVTSFSQVLEIVADSKQLSEKRNIWLSYVNRESNATYRSLGIYQLADVYYKLAEKKRDPDDISDAIAFLRNNEQTLKSMMGVNSYKTKLQRIREWQAASQ